jgi:nicotinamidase/pyrazinamidase
MNTLILVDIQNDFVPGGRLPVREGNTIIPLVNTLQNSFPLVIATQDWHPAGHRSFASTHPGKTPFETTRLRGLHQVLWPDHCVQDSKGAEFHPSLQMNKVEAIFRKGMDPEIDSYSGFFDNGYQKSTGLAGYLHEREVKKVFVCGLAADYCVAFTALDSLKEKFDTYVIEDATRPIDLKNLEKMNQDIVQQGGKIIRSEDLSRYL